MIGLQRRGGYVVGWGGGDVGSRTGVIVANKPVDVNPDAGGEREGVEVRARGDVTERGGANFRRERLEIDRSVRGMVERVVSLAA